MDYEKWHQKLQRAIEADSDGQVIESIEAYESLSSEIAASLEQLPSKVEKKLFQKLCDLLDARIGCLSSVDGELDTPPLSEIQAVQRGFADFLFKHSKQSALSAPVHTTVLHDPTDNSSPTEESSKPCKTTSNPHDVVTSKEAATHLEIKLVRLGMKDAERYVNPTIRVSVYDADGNKVEEQPEIHVGECFDPPYIEFGTSVSLVTTLGQMRQNDCAIFLEFIHYKLEKRKKSCRCWTLLEMDEIQVPSVDAKHTVVPLALELYVKPIDPKRKRIDLFTAKDLFLQLELRFLPAD